MGRKRKQENKYAISFRMKHYPSENYMTSIGYNKDEITQIVSYDFRHTTHRSCFVA